MLTTDGVPAAVDPLDETTSDEALRAQAAQLKGPSEEAIALFAPHNVDFGEDPERKEAATADPHYKLLMRLLGWESAEGEFADLQRVILSTTDSTKMCST